MVYLLKLYITGRTINSERAIRNLEEILRAHARGAEKGEKCLFIEFEESPEQLYRNAESFGWNLEKRVKDGTVQLVCHYPEDLKAEQYLKIIQNLVLKTKAKRVALDSLSALQRIYEPEEEVIVQSKEGTIQ